MDFRRQLLKVKTFLEIKKASSKPKKDLSKGPRPPWIDKLVRQLDPGTKAPPGPQKPF
tara:strand:+ start:149 stop:322 length:174 start_codon:yes stop_codon:yes gene_type:complete